MKQEWLIKEGKNKCIVFFNGWGMDNNAVEHLVSSEYDVYICSHYKSDSILKDNFEAYEEVHVVAWSLGVYMASLLNEHTKLSIKSAIAINGTLNPCHDELGIPEDIFKATLSTWTDRNRTKFMMRMLGGRAAYQSLEHVLPLRTSFEQAESLSDIYFLIQLNECSGSIAWNKALCGGQDQIFGIENQIASWKDKAEINDDMPHFPFSIYASWDQIVRQGDAR